MSDKKRAKNKKNVKTKDTVVKEPHSSAPDARVRKQPKYKSFRLHPVIKHPGPSLPTWFQITKKSLRLLAANAIPILLFLFIYGLLFLVFVRGVVAPLDIQKIRDQIDQYTNGASSFTSNVTIVGFMLQSAFQASGDISSLYQMIFIVTSTLALIWLFRQQQAGNKVSMRDAYYRGMYPLVPFLLVIMVMGLQGLPAFAGSSLYGAVVRDKLAVTTLEQVFWFLLFMLLLIFSLYLMCVSLVALFVVTLPEMTPTRALKEARKLIEHRRISILSRVVALVMTLVGVYLALVFPMIFVSAAISQVIFFILTLLILPFSIAYLFVLYRELL